MGVTGRLQIGETATDPQAGPISRRDWITAWGQGLVLALILLVSASAAGAESKRVLILNSYHHGYSWTDNIMKGIHDELHKSGRDVELYVEYMDARRYDPELTAPELEALLKLKYGRIQFDVVLVSDNNALDFVLERRDWLFFGAPLVFCGIDYYNDGMVAGRSPITGVVEDSDLAGTIEAILGMHPGLKNVAVISDASPSGQSTMEQFRYLASQFIGRVNFIELADLAVDQLTERLGILPDHTAVLLLSFQRDSTGASFGIKESTALIRAAGLPVYSCWDFYLGLGVVGGVLSSGYEQGRSAGAMVVRILKGEAPDDIAVMRRGPNVPMFDYQELRRFQIPMALLPAGSVVVNEPESLLHRYGLQLVMILCFLLLQTLAIVALVVNNAKRRRAEEAQRKSREKFEFAVEGADLGVWDYFPQTGAVTYSRTWAGILGYFPEEVRSHADFFLEHLHPDDRLRVESKLEDHVSGRTPFYESEHRLRTKDGGWVWVTDRGKTVDVDGQGRAVRVSGIMRDVTDKKMAEDILRESEERNRLLYAEAKRAEEVYRSVLHSSADAVVVYDLNGAAQYVSPAFTRIFGWREDELIGRCITFVPETERERTMAVIKDVLENGTACTGFESRRLTKSGRILEVSISASRYDDHEGRPAGMLAIIRDITETKRLMAQLQQAQKMEAVGTLAGGIAHDFNNILQAISGYVQLLMDTDCDQATGRKYLSQIARSSRRAADLVQKLLAFSRKTKVESRIMDLNKEVRQAVQLLERTIPKMVGIETELGGNLHYIKGDPMQLEQVLMNLGANARDAMPDGGRLTIKTANVVLDEDFCRENIGAKPGRYVLLTVTDTGNGMNPEEAHHVFEPFFTTKGVGKGTGLGLSSVYGIVKSHDGYIAFDTAPNQGTSFRIYLPAAMRATRADTTAIIEEQAVRGGSETILLVDDEQPILEIVRDMLKQYGYEILMAENGEEALSLFHEKGRKIDLIILDLGMPGMGGKRCLESLLQLEPSVKVIVASGYSEDGQLDELRGLGARDFLGKPYRLATMVQKVRQVLDDNPA
jgi:PAS domain S-box-containing protein